MSNATALFEHELTRRGIAFRPDSASDRYVIDHAGTELLSLSTMSAASMLATTMRATSRVLSIPS
jgi:hypothetical protein